MRERPRTSSCPGARGRGRDDASGAGRPIGGVRRRQGRIVRAAMPVVEALVGSRLPARLARARAWTTGVVAAPAAPAAATSRSAAPEDGPDQAEDEEQEEQADEEAEEPEPRVPAPAIAIAVGGDDDRGDDRSVGGRGDDPAADHEDDDEEDGCEDSGHDVRDSLSVA